LLSNVFFHGLAGDAWTRSSIGIPFVGFSRFPEVSWKNPSPKIPFRLADELILFQWLYFYFLTLFPEIKDNLSTRCITFTIKSKPRLSDSSKSLLSPEKMGV
jgi:hypothetical protein